MATNPICEMIDASPEIGVDMDAAKREELLRKIGLSEDLDEEAEYEQRHDDYVMEMPQSGERIRGRDKMRTFQENYPTPPRITVREIRESGNLIVAEAVNDYEGGDFPRRFDCRIP